ncbi:MAG: hypothetical protein IJ572_02185 [Bacilli bacterium]|nr:hypothetical protein [Bacilli bacterium]
MKKNIIIIILIVLILIFGFVLIFKSLNKNNNCLTNQSKTSKVICTKDVVKNENITFDKYKEIIEFNEEGTIINYYSGIIVHFESKDEYDKAIESIKNQNVSFTEEENLTIFIYTNLYEYDDTYKNVWYKHILDNKKIENYNCVE